MGLFKVSKSLFSRRIVVSTILLTLVPILLIGGYNTRYLYTQLNDVITENANIQVESVKRVLDTNIEIVKLLQYNLMGNKQIIDILERDELTLFELSEIKDYLREEISLNYGWTIGIVKSVYIFKDETKYINVTKNIYDSSELQQNISVYKKNSDKFGTVFSTDELENNIFHIGVPIRQQDDKQVGYVVITVDINQFSGVFTNMKTDNFALHITNDRNVIFASTQDGQVGRVLSDVKGNQIKEDLNWGGRLFIVTEIDSQKIISSVWHTIIVNLMILIVFASVATLISSILAKSMLRRFKGLVAHIKEFSKGNLDIRIPSYHDEEFDAIGHAFNGMAENIGELIHDTYQKELLIKEMQIQALQSQINPHFLFNTLTTIAVIAKRGETDLAYRMISALSKLLRERILTGKDDFSTLKTELLITDYYVYIQKVRYGKRLNYVLNKSDRALDDFLMPKLLLQPLVENAFCHGIEKKIDGGTITVNIDCCDEYLNVEILDDGLGFVPAEVNAAGDEHKHITLANLRKRLNLYYGDDFEFEIQSEIGKGTRVFIRIPTSQNNKRISKNYRLTSNLIDDILE